MRDNARLNFINAGHDNAARSAIRLLYRRRADRMNAWRYDEIDMGGAVEFNWREWAKFHWRRCGSKLNPCTIKIAMSRR